MSQCPFMTYSSLPADCSDSTSRLVFLVLPVLYKGYLKPHHRMPQYITSHSGQPPVFLWFIPCLWQGHWSRVILRHDQRLKRKKCRKCAEHRNLPACCSRARKINQKCWFCSVPEWAILALWIGLEVIFT